MKLIIGLGNPGPSCHFTRHNFGFLALDFYAKLHNLTFQPAPKFHATIAKSDQAIFAQPQTFYNESGQAISALVNYYKINPATDLLVVCDDFDLPFGQIRYREQGSAGGNNGLKSAIATLGTSTFPRLRLGTHDPATRGHLNDADFVLSKFTPTERDQLPLILRSVAAKITDFIV